MGLPLLRSQYPTTHLHLPSDGSRIFRLIRISNTLLSNVGSPVLVSLSLPDHNVVPRLYTLVRSVFHVDHFGVKGKLVEMSYFFHLEVVLRLDAWFEEGSVQSHFILTEHSAIHHTLSLTTYSLRPNLLLEERVTILFSDVYPSILSVEYPELSDGLPT